MKSEEQPVIPIETPKNLACKSVITFPHVLDNLQPKDQKHICLNDVLSSGPYGPGVLIYYKKNQKLSDQMRKMLVEAFLFYCSSTGFNVTKGSCQSLANEIKNTFKGEISVSIKTCM